MMFFQEYFPIKRIVVILVGAILGMLIVDALTWSLNHFYGPLYETENDMVWNLILFLSASVLFLILGGLLADYLFRKRFSRK